MAPLLGVQKNLCLQNELRLSSLAEKIAVTLAKHADGRHAFDPRTSNASQRLFKT